MSTTNRPAETCVKMFDCCFCSACKAARVAETFAAVREARQGDRELAALRLPASRFQTGEEARAYFDAWRERLAAEQGW